MCDWYDVGLHLNLHYTTLDNIRKDCSNDSRSQAREMFRTWLNQDPNPSYQKVAKALLETKDNAAAHQLAGAIGMALQCM